MSSSPDRSQHLFVVRIWQEASSVAPIAQWRGSVEHVTTGQRQFFADLHEIDRFIRQELGLAEPAGPGSARRALGKAQAVLVQESFRVLEPQVETLIERTFRRLFTQAPHLRPLFGADIALLRAKYATMLSVLVEGLDDYGRVEPIVLNLGRRHAGYGAQREHFALMGELLLGEIQKALGAQATQETQEAWAAAYALIAESMTAAAAYRPSPDGTSHTAAAPGHAAPGANM